MITKGHVFHHDCLKCSLNYWTIYLFLRLKAQQLIHYNHFILRNSTILIWFYFCIFSVSLNAPVTSNIFLLALNWNSVQLLIRNVFVNCSLALKNHATNLFHYFNYYFNCIEVKTIIITQSTAPSLKTILKEDVKKFNSTKILNT